MPSLTQLHARRLDLLCGVRVELDGVAGQLVDHRAHVVDADADEPDYPGSRYRVHASVAHDGFLITAIGEAPLEFSREVFKLMQLEDVDQWYASFKSVPDAR